LSGVISTVFLSAVEKRRGTLRFEDKPSDFHRRAGADDETARCDFEAMAKKITWLEAAKIIGACDRTMRQMQERYQEFSVTNCSTSDTGSGLRCECRWKRLSGY
jgi:hypothetical protein